MIKADKETKAQMKLKNVIKKYNRPPMSARSHLKSDPAIKIYPEYNPKFSRNQMKAIPIKAWETMRTVATTPFTSDRPHHKNTDNVDGFSKTSRHPITSIKKPNTAKQGSRRSLNK